MLYTIVLDLCSWFRKKNCLPDILQLEDRFVPWLWYCLLPVWVPDCCLLSCMTLPPSWIKALLLRTITFVSLCTWVPAPALSQRDQHCLNLSPGAKRNTSIYSSHFLSRWLFGMVIKVGHSAKHWEITKFLWPRVITSTHLSPSASQVAQYRP